jgi:replicative DNA helicase
MDKKKVKQSIAATIAESVGDGTFRTKNVDLERKILYQCFRKAFNLQVITANLTVDDFSDVRHKIFYKYILNSNEQGRLPDPSVCLATAKRSVEFEVDPDDYESGMRDLLESEDEIDVEAACHLLHDLYIVRKILGFAKRIDSNISEGADTADLIGHAEEFIRGVATDSIKANTLKTIDDIVESSPKGIYDFIENERDTITTPFPTLNEYINGFEPGKLVIIGARPATGKAQPLSSLILKSDGSWVKMGDIKVGDTLASVDGWRSEVTGIFPQGKKEVFKVWFEDGRSVECCRDHLWRVQNRKTGKSSTVTTEKLEELLREPEARFGSIGVPRFCGEFGFKSFNQDRSILDIVKENGNRIPLKYYQAGRRTRLEALSSVLGFGAEAIEKIGYIRYDTDDYHLADDIRNLVRSLGGTCNVAIGHRTESGYSYCLYIELDKPFIGVVGVESTGTFEEMQCISVSHPRQLYITDGFTVTHNTALLCQLAFEAANKQRSVLFYSHEMWAKDMWTRIFCQQVGIMGDDFLHNCLSEDEKARVIEFVRHSAPRSLRISDSGGKTPLSLRAELARYKAKHGNPDMVVVDYLQRMKCPNKSGNRFQEVSEISRSLKDIAMEFNTRMIVAAQVSRAAENRPGGDNRPQMSDLRESGDIEADADLIVFPHRPSLYWKKAGQPPPPDELIVVKNRQGRTGVIQVQYNGPYYKFVEKV